MASQEARIRRQVLLKARQLGETSVTCSVEDGHVVLDGVVSSDERARQLEAAASSIEGVLHVTNDLVVEAFEAAVSNVAHGVDLTPDFTARVGASDATEAVSEAEPYFPATDPVVKPDRSTDGIEMLNGFAETADEEAAIAALPGLPRGDDEIRDAVLAALHFDAATTDLSIDVEVQDGVVFLRGVVPSLEDVDQAESVAASVAGVQEVQEELQVEGM